MSEFQDRFTVVTPQRPRALLLCQENFPPDLNLARVVSFFGIVWEAVTVGQNIGGTSSEFCTLSSAHCVAEAIEAIGDTNDTPPYWMSDARSVYIYDFQDTNPCQRLLRLLTSDAQGSIRKLNAAQALISITDDFPEMCGPMSGMRVPVDLDGGFVFDVADRAENFQSILTANDGQVFFRVRWRGVQFYLNISRGIIDLSSPSAMYFDVKKSFCQAVPITMYLKWAFRDACWTSPETSACLIVDDPPLTPRYGFLRFRETLDLMDSHKFTTTIAFIPWNWRRTDPRTVAIFQQRPDRFSLCVHGCDHTATEFAARSTALLNKRIKLASQRMEALLQRTSLRCDRVMVFPQGAFSPETGRALKLNGFIAAVNTEVAPWKEEGNKTTISDLWNVALMKYGTFPIFTRRYLTHGVENFAFDALLGKPCMIVAHHDAFRNHGRDLVDFIAKLNSLKWKLCWRPLGDAIRHSFTVRNEYGTTVIKMLAKTLVIENPSNEPRDLILTKEESDTDCVKAVLVNQTAIDFGYSDGYLQFRVKLSPKEMAEVCVIYFDKLDGASGTDDMAYIIKTCIRRYLSEIRDNYLSQSDFLYKTAAKIRQFLK